MKLGNFSVSLTVKNIKASASFYEKLGFSVYGGDIEQGWQILKNNDCVIGLFQGMFDKNMLTFNPGWERGGNPAVDYTDIRALQSELKSKGIKPIKEVKPNTSGPASFMIADLDGNLILVDQHV